jgi:murein DD-endopeptidase MepM/ murein hydrolase activator NlpD
MTRAAFLPALAILLMAAADKPAPTSEGEHVVRPGETLGGIAARADVPRILIAEANGLKPPYALRSGQTLKIPRTRHHTVAAGETGFEIAYRYGVPLSAIAMANGIKTDAVLRPGQELLIPTVIKPAAAHSSSVSGAASPSPAATASPEPATGASPPDRLAWPVSGAIRRTYKARGSGSYHDGIDITAEEGTAVRASAAGRVIYATQGPREYGLTVIIHHGARWTTTYSYLSRITVKDGERVKAGERIGLIGHTGIAQGDQLHYEVRHNREALDPVQFLPKAD